MESICILRLSALGDVTHVLPTVLALREHWPRCRVTWIIGKLERKLLDGLPGVEFITFDKSRGAAAYARLRRELDGRRFDALLHMQLSFRANLAAWLIGADLRVGYDRVRSRELHGLRLNRRIRHAEHQHVCEALSSFVEPLGLAPASPRWTIPLTEADRAFAADHVDPDRPSLVITPCSSHRLRNWLPRRYAAVADHAAARGWQVILCGGPSDYELEFAAEIRSAMSAEALDLTGRDTLKQLAATLEAADLVISPDTGPAHIANAMGTPVIGLYAATDPHRSGPYKSLDLTVNRYPEAARKYRNKAPEQLRWGTKIEAPGVMELIEIDDVIEQFELFCARSE